MKSRRFVLWSNLALGALLMLVVWALLVWVASRPALKALVDLTPQRINSVDPVTVELLQELRAQKTEIQFHLFAPPVSGEGADDRGRQELSIRRRLVDLTRMLLKTYAYLGGEVVRIVDHDFAAIDQQQIREAAQKFDYKVAEGEVLVVAVRMAGREWRHRKLSVISDLAVIDVPNSGMPGPGPKMSMPVLKNYKGEEAISSALKTLLVQGIPVVYVLRDGAIAPGADLFTGTPTGYDSLFLALQQAGFDVRVLSFRETPAVPADATLVLVVQPRNDLLDRDADALFDYCKRGGRLVLNYSWNGPEPDMNPSGGRLGELLGFQLSREPVFHMIQDLNGRTGGRGLSGDPAVAKLLLQYSMHPAMRRLAEARRWVEMTQALEVEERPRAPTGMRREPLLATGEQAWRGRIGSDGYPSYQAPPVGLQRRVVAMAIEVDPPPPADGKADDGKADGGKADGGKGGGEDADRKPASRSDARPGVAIVFGGVFANNAGMLAGFGDLALNVCNWLAERKVLLDIKGSKYEATHIALQPQQLTRIYWFLVAGVPSVFFVLGVIVVVIRRRQ